MGGLSRRVVGLGCGGRLDGGLRAFCGGGGLCGESRFSVRTVRIFASKGKCSEKKQREGEVVGWLIEAGHRCLFAPIASFVRVCVEGLLFVKKDCV